MIYSGFAGPLQGPIFCIFCLNFNKNYAIYPPAQKKIERRVKKFPNDREFCFLIFQAVKMKSRNIIHSIQGGGPDFIPARLEVPTEFSKSPAGPFMEPPSAQRKP